MTRTQAQWNEIFDFCVSLTVSFVFVGGSWLISGHWWPGLICATIENYRWLRR